MKTLKLTNDEIWCIRTLTYLKVKNIQEKDLEQQTIKKLTNFLIENEDNDFLITTIPF